MTTPFARSRLALAPAAAALAFAAGCTTETVVETKIEKGTAVDHGRALFSDPAASSSTLNDFSCATCHVAEGSPPAGRVLPGAPLAGVTKRPTFWGGQDNDLLRAVNDCRYYFMLAQEPWTADDVEARAMYAYLDSLPPAQPESAPFTVVTAVADLAPGDAAAGAAVYQGACLSCHGALHTGAGKLADTAPRLPDDPNAEHTEYTPTEQRLIFVEKTRHGGFLGYGGVMPPFSSEALDDGALADLLAYLELY